MLAVVSALNLSDGALVRVEPELFDQARVLPIAHVVDAELTALGAHKDDISVTRHVESSGRSDLRDADKLLHGTGLPNDHSLIL